MEMCSSLHSLLESPRTEDPANIVQFEEQTRLEHRAYKLYGGVLRNNLT